jgi:hypothetical protein
MMLPLSADDFLGEAMEKHESKTVDDISNVEINMII